MQIKKEVEHNLKYGVAGAQPIIHTAGTELIITSSSNNYANGYQPIIDFNTKFQTLITNHNHSSQSDKIHLFSVN